MDSVDLDCIICIAELVYIERLKRPTYVVQYVRNKKVPAVQLYVQRVTPANRLKLLDTLPNCTVALVLELASSDCPVPGHRLL